MWNGFVLFASSNFKWYWNDVIRIISNQTKNMSFCSFSKGEIYKDHFESGVYNDPID